MNEEGPMLSYACAAVREELGAFLDDELDPAARETVMRHLTSCDACRAELTLQEAVAGAVRGLPRPAPPEAMHYRLLARARAETTSQRHGVFIIEQQGHRWTRWCMTRTSVEEPEPLRRRREASEERSGSVYQYWTHSGDQSTFYRCTRHPEAQTRD